MRARWWVGVAAGLAVGLGAAIVMSAGTGDASAQSGFRASAEQLRINQRISQAAVRRSNEGLVLLDPIRRQPKLPQKVLGWRTQDLRDGAVTGAKITNGSVAEADLASAVTGRLPAWAVVNANGTLARSSGGITAQRTGPGLYRVDLNRAVGACAWTGTQVETTPPELGLVGIELDSIDPERLVVLTTTGVGGAPADRAFSLQVTC